MFTQNTNKEETHLKPFVQFVSFVLWSYVCLFAILTKCVSRHSYICTYRLMQTAQNSVMQLFGSPSALKRIVKNKVDLSSTDTLEMSSGHVKFYTEESCTRVYLCAR